MLLFMDNAGCHPPEIAEGYSNIKVMFLPANKTSKLQPLDFGIINTFKINYRKLFIRYVLTKIDTCSTATEVVNSITILHAIRWVAEVWKSALTIKKCFRKAGILDKDFCVVKEKVLEEDPFRDLDPQVEEEEEDTDLLELMVYVNGDNHCSVDTYLNEEILPTCFDMDNPSWEDEFFTDLGESTEQVGADDCDDEESTTIQTDVSPPPFKIGSYREALNAFEDVAAFLEDKGHTSATTKFMAFSDQVVSLHCQALQSNSGQSSLTEFI